MFSSPLTYYHGTTERRWRQVQTDGCFRPNDAKAVGRYWITKGVYFVCENPYVALWYALLTCWRHHNEGDPVVLAISYQVDGARAAKVLNLLTADGQHVLAKAHHRFQQVMTAEMAKDKELNLDSTVLELLLSKSSTVRAVIAAFQEGASYQELVHQGCYNNPYVAHHTGICPGDHAEICFVPDLPLGEVGEVQVVNHDALTDAGSEASILWPLVCRGMTSDWVDTEKRDEFLEFLARRYPEGGIA